MLKRSLAILLSITAGLLIASCRVDQVPGQTDTPIPPTAVEPTSSPIATLEPAPEAEPTLTDTSEAPTSIPICFTPFTINPVAFMPDSNRLLVRDSSGVQIFNLQTTEEESFLKAPKNLLTAAISPDGGILAWSLEDNTIQLVSLPDQSLIKTLEGHTDVIYKLRFSPTGDRLFSASHDGWVRVWDSSGNPLPAIQPGGEVLGIGISPDGTMLATIPSDGPVSLWDLESNKKVTELGGTSGYDTSDATFSPDGQYLGADLATGLYLWRIADGELIWDEVKNSMAVTFSPDARFMAYSNVDDNNNVILASPDGTQIVRTLPGMQGPVWELFFSPDSSMIAATDGLEIRIWQVEDGKLLYIGKATCP